MANWREAGPQEKPQTGDFLYVFQAENGRIKIGRSIHPWRRRQSLEAATGMRLAEVGSWKGRGCEETGIHRTLFRHRIRGEWFQCNATSKRDIENAIGDCLVFPFSSEVARQDISDSQAEEIERMLLRRVTRGTPEDGMSGDEFNEHLRKIYAKLGLSSRIPSRRLSSDTAGHGQRRRRDGHSRLL